MFSNRLYKTKIKVGKPICLHTCLSKQSWLCNARLGHTNFNNISAMSKKELVKGLPTITELNQIRDSCLVGKQTRSNSSKKASYQAEKVLSLVHGDIYGPISPSTIAKNKYIFILIDDYSWFMWSYLLKEKKNMTIICFK